MKWYNKIYGIATQNNKEKFLLYTDYNYINIDLKQEIPSQSKIVLDKDEKSRNADWNKRLKNYHKAIFNQNYKNVGRDVVEQVFGEEKNEEVSNSQSKNFKITNRFSSILFMDYIDTDTLLVVENDWNKILKRFPESVYKPSYGS